MQQTGKEGIKSIAVGARLLQVLIQTPHSLPLKELSAAARMAPGKAHRYLVSLVQTGLVERDPGTKRYALGSMAFQLGLTAIGRFDPLGHAIKVQSALRDRIDETVVLSVWGNHGPTIVHIEESSHPVIMTMKVGAVMPILATAAGLVFGALMPTVVTAKLIESELKSASGPIPFARTKSAVEKLFRSVRKERIATNKGHLTPGVSAIAVSLVSPQGQLVAAMSVIGSEDRIDMRLNGPTADALRASAKAFSSWPAENIP